ncbi:HTH domain-containing protein [Tunturiibacter empetritectus]|uniref:helix-turn-helix transcriptional regulator n=1 Tax=Tunturiibacter empetritectus TaxID=3069691 RepID=UPI003D9AE3A9
MYDPIMRVLTVLEILQARDHVTGTELAERLEVDLRTIQRYVVRLRDLSIPIESSRGVGGSYRLRPGFRLPPLLFTNEEAFALSLGLRALRQLGLSAFAPATEGALAKLGRVLPDALRESILTVEDVVAVEPGPGSFLPPPIPSSRRPRRYAPAAAYAFPIDLIPTPVRAAKLSLMRFCTPMGDGI